MYNYDLPLSVSQGAPAWPERVSQHQSLLLTPRRDPLLSIEADGRRPHSLAGGLVAEAWSGGPHLPSHLLHPDVQARKVADRASACTKPVPVCCVVHMEVTAKPAHILAVKR